MYIYVNFIGTTVVVQVVKIGANTMMVFYLIGKFVIKFSFERKEEKIFHSHLTVYFILFSLLEININLQES